MNNDSRPWLRMCVYCRRVRDYEGDTVWETRENVSDAEYQISHGCCDSCFAERYGSEESEEDEAQ